MAKENNFELIEKYLEGSLDGEVLKDFERRMTEDTEFAQEVDFQRDIESVLAHQPVDDFRANLQKLDEKYENQSKNNGGLHWAFYLIGLIIILGSVWGLMKSTQTNELPINQNEPETTEQSAPTETTPVEIENPMELEEEIPTEVEENPVQESDSKPTIVEPEKPENKEQQPAPKPPQKSRPIAGNFEPNAFLESRLGSLRSDELNIESPLPNTEFSLQNGAIQFQLTGTFKTEDDIEDKEVNVYIFSNKMEDYEAFNTLLSQELNFEENGDGFQFELSESVSLTQGLYYFQIEDEMGDILYIGKFVVN
jgi:hypothetical protein